MSIEHGTQQWDSDDFQVYTDHCLWFVTGDDINKLQ